MSTLHPQLAAVQDQLEEVTARARRLSDSAGDRSFNQRPHEAAWSVAECLAHLSLTTKAYLPLIDEALATLPQSTVPESHRYRRDPMGRFLCWVLEPPYRMKVKTLAPFVPSEVKDRQAVLDEFVTLQDALAERVVACSGRDLGRARIASPFNARMRYNLYSALGAVLAHERRHLWQADRTLELLKRAG